MKNVVVYEETKKHISKVLENIEIIRGNLLGRASIHDSSKLEEFEFPIFCEYNEKLKNCTYGSDQYQQYLKEMQPALDHHYANNRHHPEHFENDINDMNLVDIIEMFCDWKAATERHTNGDINKSIEINSKRFDISNQLKKIFENSVDLFDKKD